MGVLWRGGRDDLKLGGEDGDEEGRCGGVEGHESCVEGYEWDGVGNDVCGTGL